MYRNIFSKLIKHSSSINIRNCTHNLYTKRFMSSYFNDNHDFIYFKENINEINKLNKLNIKFGFSNYALKSLNNIVYAEFYKEVDDFIEKDEIIGAIENVKTSFDIISGISGSIISLNNEFINNIQENNEPSFEDLKNLSDYNDENGLTLFELEIDNNEINNVLDLINNKEFMNTEEYNKFLEKTS